MGLVYVAAFAPDEGELLIDRVAEVIIDPSRFRAVFTADLPQVQSDLFALSQRLIAAAAFSEKNGPAAWKSLPVWAAVGSADLAAGSDVTRSMAQRAGAQITEIDGSHVIMITAGHVSPAAHGIRASSQAESRTETELRADMANARHRIAVIVLDGTLALDLAVAIQAFGLGRVQDRPPGVACLRRRLPFGDGRGRRRG